MSDRGSLGVEDLPEGTLEAIVEAITSEMQTDAVIIYGSYARHGADEDSDVDILALSNMDGSRLTEAAVNAGIKMWGLGVARDFFAMNTDKFRGRLAADDEFARNVARDGIVLYGQF